MYNMLRFNPILAGSAEAGKRDKMWRMKCDLNQNASRRRDITGSNVSIAVSESEIVGKKCV